MVAPLLLTLILGLLDFSIYLLRQDTMVSAAKDGARKAFLKVTGADVGAQTKCSAGGSATFTAICTAVKARVAGTPVQSVQVTCYTANTTTVRTCSSARNGEDTAEVVVAWSYAPPTIVGKTFIGTQTRTSRARTVVE